MPIQWASVYFFLIPLLVMSDILSKCLKQFNPKPPFPVSEMSLNLTINNNNSSFKRLRRKLRTFGILSQRVLSIYMLYSFPDKTIMYTWRSATYFRIFEKKCYIVLFFAYILKLWAGTFFICSRELIIKEKKEKISLFNRIFNRIPIFCGDIVCRG